MTCLLKTHPNYIEVSKEYGELATEVMIYGYNRAYGKTIDKFVYPNLKQLKEYLKTHRWLQYNALKTALDFYPGLESKHVVNLLRGIITRASKDVSWQVATTENTETNKQIIDLLVKEYPSRFRTFPAESGRTNVTIKEGNPNPYIDNLDSVLKPLLDYNKPIAEYANYIADIRSMDTRKFRTAVAMMCDRLSALYGLQYQFINIPGKKGMIEGSVVKINLAEMTPDTPIHEFFHPFLVMLKEKNKTLYDLLKSSAKNVTNLKGEKIIDLVKEKYKGLPEEAFIDEVITESVGLAAIGQLQETPTNNSFLKDFLQQVLDFFKSLFGFDLDLDTPISYVANGFISGEFSINLKSYSIGLRAFQKGNPLSKPDLLNFLNQLRNDMVTILQEEGELLNHENERLRHYKNKVTNKNYHSVHTKDVDPIYLKAYKKKYKATDLSKFLADFGTAGHDFFNKTILSFLDENYQLKQEIKQGGFPALQKHVEDLVDYIDKNEPFLLDEEGRPFEENLEGMYTKLRIVEYIGDLFSYYCFTNTQDYGLETMFVPEQVLTQENQDKAGTSDFIIFGQRKFTNLDWKFQSASQYDKYSDSFSIKKIVDIVKETAYKAQLKAYAKMITESTGYKLDYSAAVPILLLPQPEYIEGEKVGYYISSVSLAPFGRKKQQEYFNKFPDLTLAMPVVVKGDESQQPVDELVSKLESMLEKYLQANNTFKERKDLRELKITELRRIIRELRVMNRTRLLTSRILEHSKAVESEILNDFETADIDKLRIIQDELKGYTELTKYFNNLPESEFINLAKAEDEVSRTLNKIADFFRKKLEYDAENKFNIKNLSANEKAYTGPKALFREMSAISRVKTIKYFNALKTLLFGKAHQEKLKGYSVLQENSQGVTFEDFKLFFQKTAGGKLKPKLIKKYDFDRFLSQLEKLEEQHLEGDSELNRILRGEDPTAYEDFVKKYLIFDEEKFNEVEAKYRETVVHRVLVQENVSELTPELQQRVDRIVREEFTNKKRSPLINSGDRLKLNFQYYSFNPNTESAFYTPEYIELAKSEKRVNLFNYFIEVNKKAYNEGLIKNPYTFYPSVLATAQEKSLLGTGAVISGFKDFFKLLDPELETEEYTKTPDIDPITKKPIRKIKRLYMDDLSKEGNGTELDYSDYSYNLVKNFANWMSFVEDYSARAKMEDTAQLLIQLEQSKRNVEVDNKGNAVYEEDEQGQPRIRTLNQNENITLLEDFINYSIYGVTKYSDKGDQFNVTINGTTYSGIKAIRKLMAWRSTTSLGLNITSGASALFGAEMNLGLEAGRNGIFTKSDVAKSAKLLSESMFKTDNALKAIKLLHQIDPIIEDLNQIRAHELSVSKVDRFLTSDKLYVFLRKGDQFVQNKIALSVLNNYAIVNGNLEFITDYIKRQENYDAQYQELASQERFIELDALKKSVEQKIEDFKKTNSLLNTEPSDNANPELTPEHKIKLRDIIQKMSKQVIGNSSSEDITRAKLHFLGLVGLQFRNWIPRLLTQRFGDAEVDPVSGHLNWGKYMTLVNAVGKDFFSTLSGAVGKLNKLSFENIQSKYYKLLQEHIENGGTQEDFIPLSEFVELYRANIRSTLLELSAILSLFILIGSLQFLWDDDDESLSGWQKMTLRTLNKFKNEISFFILPSSYTQLLKTSVPVVSTLEDMERFVTHSIKESWNQGQNLITGSEEEDLKYAKPTKYFFKLFPITKEMLNWMAVIDDEFRKENMIKI